MHVITCDVITCDSLQPGLPTYQLPVRSGYQKNKSCGLLDTLNSCMCQNCHYVTRDRAVQQAGTDVDVDVYR
jgi:hypothetical protein